MSSVGLSGGRGGKVEVDEVGAAARRSGVAGFPDGAVAGEMGEELRHRDFRAVFGGEPGEAIGALSRAASTTDANDNIGVGRESVGGHGENISRTRGRGKAAAGEGRVCASDRSRRRRRAAAPFTRARPAPRAGTPVRYVKRTSRASSRQRLAPLAPSGTAQAIETLHVGDRVQHRHFQPWPGRGWRREGRSGAYRSRPRLRRARTLSTPAG